MNDALMIDIETLGTTPTAAIIQIGATAFDYHSNEMKTVTIDVVPDLRLTNVDWDTIRWWLNQSEEARISITRTPRNSPVEALEDLNTFFNQHCHINTEVWAYPPSFDIVILENLYKTFRVDTPWKRQKILCVRTLKTLAGKVSRPKPTVAHDAGADSLAQAKWVNLMLGTFDE